VPVDNELYNRLSETWWDENEAFGLLRTVLGPVRFGYFRRALIEKYGRDPQGIKVLDVGCGGGLLAEEFARLGCKVTGLDPSEASLSTASRHAQQSGLEITYRRGVGEQIPYADASFDVVICCDVLEHVNDGAQVIGEIARVLNRGGIFFYDTINATWRSWLMVIKMAQEWKLTRFFPPDLHDWKHFIKPRQLQLWMQRSGLQNEEVKGMSPRGNPFVIMSRFAKYRRGLVTLGEMAEEIKFRESRDVSVLYMGHAVKQRSS